MAGVLVVGDSGARELGGDEATLAGAADPAGPGATPALFLSVSALVIAIAALAVSPGIRVAGLRADRR